MSDMKKVTSLKSSNGHDVTKRAIIDVNSIIYGRNYDIYASIIAQLPTSQPFGDLSQKIHPITDCEDVLFTHLNPSQKDNITVNKISHIFQAQIM